MSENNEGALTPGAPSLTSSVEVKGSGESGDPGIPPDSLALEHTEVMLPASRPYGGWFDEVVDVLIELFQADGIDPHEAIEKVVVEHGQLIIFIVVSTCWCS